MAQRTWQAPKFPVKTDQQVPKPGMMGRSEPTTVRPNAPGARVAMNQQPSKPSPMNQPSALGSGGGFRDPQLTSGGGNPRIPREKFPSPGSVIPKDAMWDAPRFDQHPHPPINPAAEALEFAAGVGDPDKAEQALSKNDHAKAGIFHERMARFHQSRSEDKAAAAHMAASGAHQQASRFTGDKSPRKINFDRIAREHSIRANSLSGFGRGFGSDVWDSPEFGHGTSRDQEGHAAPLSKPELNKLASGRNIHVCAMPQDAASVIPSPAPSKTTVPPQAHGRASRDAGTPEGARKAAQTRAGGGQHEAQVYGPRGRINFPRQYAEKARNVVPRPAINPERWGDVGTAEGARKAAATRRAHAGPARPNVQNAHYHQKSDAQLHYIMKDAHEAARAMRGHDPRAESKYLDQMNDAATILHYRSQGGRQESAAPQRDQALKPHTMTTESLKPPTSPGTLKASTSRDWVQHGTAINRVSQKKAVDAKRSIATDPLTDKGRKIMSAMQDQYGKERGKSVFYASKNKGTIIGVDQGEWRPARWEQHQTNDCK
jgi:hypothetical protein